MGEAVETYPPIPQQLGSVTFRAAEVATAASAEDTILRSAYIGNIEPT